MELYETSTTWRDVTREDSSKYELSQSSRALVCLVNNLGSTGYAYVDPVHLEIEGRLGKASLVRDCDLIECVYGVSGYRAWYTVGGHPYPIDRKLALIAVHFARVFLWVEGKTVDDIHFQFPDFLTVKKCMLQPVHRKELAHSGQVSL